jgi:hypothetical protein
MGNETRNPEDRPSTTEHCLLSHRTPIATKVECRISPQDS